MGLDDASSSVVGFGLPRYRQEGCGQAAFPYLEAILAFSFVMFAWELYLETRQYRCLAIKTIPTPLTRVVKKLDGKDDSGGLLAKLTAKLGPARAYSTDKMRLGFVESVFGEAEGVAILLLGMMYVCRA